jgi:hypothetical protein
VGRDGNFRNPGAHTAATAGKVLKRRQNAQDTTTGRRKKSGQGPEGRPCPYHLFLSPRKAVAGKKGSFFMGVKGIVWQSAWELTRTRGRAVREVTSDALKNEPSFLLCKGDAETKIRHQKTRAVFFKSFLHKDIQKISSCRFPNHRTSDAKILFP